MAQPTYTLQNVMDRLRSRVHGKYTNLIDPTEIINSAVRTVLGDLDLRGSKRRATLAPNLFDDVYSYTLPTDVKGNKLIDILPQVKRERKPDWDLVPEDYFERMKEYRENLVSIADDDLDRRLLVSRLVWDNSIVLGQMESLNGDGDTWVGFNYTGDTDGQSVNDTDVKQDGDDYVTGNAALRFRDNGDTSATQVGIENSGLDAVDLSDYLVKGSGFVRARLSTGDTNILQLTLRVGSDSSNYYEVSDSTTNEGLPFVTGWNLVRVDFTGKTTTGTPTDTAIDYAAVYWTKTAATHLTDTDYGFDHLVIRRGQIHDLIYYSRYLWQTSAGVYSENSSAVTDRVNVFNDELELIITKAWEFASYELREYKDAEIAAKKYENDKATYMMNNPSEAMILIQPVYEFESAPINHKGSLNNDTMST